MPHIFNSFEFLEVMSWRCPSEVLSPPTVASHPERRQTENITRMIVPSLLRIAYFRLKKMKKNMSMMELDMWMRMSKFYKCSGKMCAI